MAKSKGYVVWGLILVYLKIILILLLRSKSSNNRKKAPRYENIESSSGSEVEFDSNEPFKDDEMESFNKESDKVLLNKINSKKSYDSTSDEEVLPFDDDDDDDDDDEDDENKLKEIDYDDDRVDYNELTKFEFYIFLSFLKINFHFLLIENHGVKKSLFTILVIILKMKKTQS
jgi:hypothetical protein